MPFFYLRFTKKIHAEARFFFSRFAKKTQSEEESLFFIYNLPKKITRKLNFFWSRFTEKIRRHLHVSGGKDGKKNLDALFFIQDLPKKTGGICISPGEMTAKITQTFFFLFKIYRKNPAAFACLRRKGRQKKFGRSIFYSRFTEKKPAAFASLRVK